MCDREGQLLLRQLSSQPSAGMGQTVRIAGKLESLFGTSG